MNLVADEGVDRPVVERLRRDGHQVVYVAELSPSVADEEVLRQANAGSAVLMTADKDFGDLVFRQGLAHSGVVLLRLAGLAERDQGRDRRRGVPLSCGGTDRSVQRRVSRPGTYSTETVISCEGSNSGIQPTAFGRD